MAANKAKIERNLQLIRKNVEVACAKANRLPQEVSLVAVTKTVGADAVEALLELGVTDLGENRAQQLVTRAEETAAYLQARPQPLAGKVRWHMIGHVQRNKVKAVLEVAEVIHSVDSLRLAEEINARAEQMHRVVEVFLQVNCSQEEQKYGVAVGAATHLGELIATLANVRLVGLMTMAPLVADTEQARASFVRLREVFEEMRTDRIGGDHLRHLSMGMSNDYVVAVEEGATILRIGTALFA
jgi:pyridoxal phosphate enzyme (YggS family)